jgi:YVTN family beta-propeller protein
MRILQFTIAIILFLIAALQLSLGASEPQLRQLGMASVAGPPGFSDVAFAKGMFLLSHPAASCVDVFDPAKRRVVAQITGLMSPRGIAVDEQNGKIYVADSAKDAIAVIDTDTWKLTDSIPVQGSPAAVLLDETGSRLYWSDPKNEAVSLLDVNTRQNTGAVAVGGAPRGMALDSDRHLVLVSLQDTHQIVAIDPQLNIVGRFPLNASQPTGLAYDARYKTLYVAARFAVLSLNAQTGTEINRVAAPPSVDRLWLDPESRTVYAAGEGALLMIRAVDGRLSAQYELAPEVKGHTVAYDAGRKMVLLPGGREGKSKIMLLRPLSGQEQASEALVR